MKHDSAVTTYVHPELAPWALRGTVGGTSDYEQLLNVPSEFPPSAHQHVVDDITDFPTFEGGSFIDVTATATGFEIALSGEELPVAAIPFDSILTGTSGDVLVDSSGFVLTSS